MLGEGASGALDGEEGRLLDFLWFLCSFFHGEAGTNWLFFPEPSPSYFTQIAFLFLEIVSPSILLPPSFFLKRRTEVGASPLSPLLGLVADLVGGLLAAP